MVKPTLRANQGGPSAKVQPSKPLCPYHAEEMNFSAERLCWVCPHPGCAMVSWPKTDVEQGKPIIGRGELELVQAGDRSFLRAGNILIEVTDELYDTEKVKGVYRVTLSVKSAVITDGYERTALE